MNQEVAYNQIRVMIIGKLENPKLQCLKELQLAESNYTMIPLGVKKSGAQQKFRIPFKNLSNTLEADFDFLFVKLSQKEEENKDEVYLTPYFEFYCQPGNMKIPASQQGFLNVLIKVNTVKLATLEASLSDKAFKKLLSKPINKLLIARLKDTSVLYSFFVSINLINE